MTAIVVTTPTSDDEGGWGAFSLETVALGSRHYFNVRETIDQESRRPARWRITAFPFSIASPATIR